MNKGIFYIILSGLSFAIVNFFVKILGTGNGTFLLDHVQKYPAHELVLARSIVSFSLSAWVVRRKKIPFLGHNKKWLLIRGFAGTIALTLFFYTINHLPIALATVIQYLSPIFTILLAIIFLKEKVLPLQWFFILFSFSGVGLIAIDKLFNLSDVSESFSFFHIGIGILSASLSGLAYTAVMKLKKTDAPITIVMYFPMVAIPLMTLLCLWKFTFPQGIEWLFLIFIGLFTQSAQIFLTKALHLGDASVITPFQYLGIIYMYLIGYFAFNERLSFVINLGIVIILSGILANTLLSVWNKKRIKNR